MKMNKFWISRIVIANCSQVLFKLSANHKLLSRHCSARRALLFVPGNDENKFRKALNLKIDCIILDCEYGVPQDQKEKARENIKKYLDEGPVTQSNPEWGVRISPTQTPELFEADLNAVLSAKYLPISICLPKVNNVDQLQWFAEKVWSALMKRPEDDRGPIKLLLLIESAIAVITLPELCKKAVELSSVAPIIPVGLILGNEILTANIGGQRTQSGIELLYVRQKMVVTAKAFGLQAIDNVFPNYEDHVGFLESCNDGNILGFTGKQVIHPDQVSIAQDKFAPKRSRIQWAKWIIKTFKQNQEKRVGAFTFENEMVDMPTLKLAENILEAAKAAGKFGNESNN